MSVDFSQVLATCSDTVKLWSPPSESPFFINPQPSNHIAFHPENRTTFLVSLTDQSLINVYDKSSKRTSIVTTHPSVLLSFSPSGNVFAALSSTRTQVSIFQYSTLSPLASFSTPAPVTSMSMSKNYIAVGLKNGATLVHDIHTGNQKHKFQDSLRRAVTHVTFNSISSQYLASGFISGNIIIYNLQRNDVFHTFYAVHRSPISSLCFSPKNLNLLASVGRDCKLRFLDFRSAKKVVLEIHTSKPISSVTFHPKGQAVAIGNQGGEVNVFDLRVVGKFKNEQGHEVPLYTWVAGKGVINHLDWINTSAWVSGSPKVLRSPEKVVKSPISSPTRAPPPPPDSPPKTSVKSPVEKVYSDPNLSDDMSGEEVVHSFRKSPNRDHSVEIGKSAKFSVKDDVNPEFSYRKSTRLETNENEVENLGNQQAPDENLNQELESSLRGENFVPKFDSKRAHDDDIDIVDHSNLSNLINNSLLDLKIDLSKSISSVHVELIKFISQQNEILTNKLIEQQEEIKGLRSEVSIMGEYFKQHFGTKLASFGAYLSENKE
ncbi:hypothetical protein P9112_010507 [Eukaryota sp. TZLM1-RC]